MTILVLKLVAFLLLNGILKSIFLIPSTSTLPHPCTLLTFGKLYLDLYIVKTEDI